MNSAYSSYDRRKKGERENKKEKGREKAHWFVLNSVVVKRKLFPPTLYLECFRMSFLISFSPKVFVNYLISDHLPLNVTVITTGK